MNATACSYQLGPEPLRSILTGGPQPFLGVIYVQHSKSARTTLFAHDAGQRPEYTLDPVTSR